MNAKLTLTSILAAAALCGCRQSNGGDAPGGTFLVCLFDRSITSDSAETKARYLADFSKLAADLQSGDTVVADATTENPTATMRFPIHVVLPAYDPSQSSPLRHRRELQTAKRTLLDQVGQLVRDTTSTRKTAILDAVLVSRKALQSEAGRKAARRVLVLFSDMIEDSGLANFEREIFTPQRMEALIEAERSEGRLPDLAGVEVWVAGATTDRTLGVARIRAIENFWMTYFSRCGALLTPERYGSALLNFTVSRR